MPQETADVVICGAGIAGIAAAYHLAVGQGIRDVVLVDERPPLSLTSDKSTECYRNWWPGPGDAMVSLMNRSIDLMEELAYETGNVFHLNRRGYLFVTADPARIPDFTRAADEAAELGAGPARIYTGQPGEPDYVPAPPEGLLVEAGVLDGHRRLVGKSQHQFCLPRPGIALGLAVLQDQHAHYPLLDRQRNSQPGTGLGAVNLEPAAGGLGNKSK